MNEMVERVARAIALEDRGNDVWSAISEGHGEYEYNAKEDYRDWARAAIKAMREPTEAMLVAGLEHEGTDLASEYRAMIDAASHG